MADDAEDREDEILVLKSMYSEIFEIEEGVAYEMAVPVELPWETWNLAFVEEPRSDHTATTESDAENNAATESDTKEDTEGAAAAKENTEGVAAAKEDTEGAAAAKEDTEGAAGGTAAATPVTPLAVDVARCAPPAATEAVLEVAHVPPIMLRWRLPEDYPSVSAPRFQLRAAWLNRDELTVLAAHLDELASDAAGYVVMHEWIDFLQHGVFSHLELARDHTVTTTPETPTASARVQQVPSRVDDVRAYLKNFNGTEAVRQWESSLHECAICLTARSGRDSHRFSACGHVFCKECISAHFLSRISSGKMRGLTCPAHRCTTQAHPNEVRQYVSKEEFERWERLLFERTLDELGSIVYCPSCQSPVWRDDLDGTTPTLAVCSHCSHTFCAKCKRTYHGVVPCVAMGDMQTMIQAYKAASPRSRKELEDHFSVELFNEVRNQLWIEKFTKPCPFCTAPIQKSGGCNHITCASCGRESCWLCGRAYDYTHFYVTTCVQFDEFDRQGWQDTTRELLD